MGLIIKNRSGSLDKNRLEYIFEQGLKVYLRILSSFIEIIKEEEPEKFFTEFLTEKINQIVEHREEETNKKLSIDKIEKLARSIYWNLNFGVLYSFITLAINSLGSKNLLDICKAVSERENTPSSFIVNQGIRMWYSKSLSVDEIVGRISKKKDFSRIAKTLLNHKIVEHCRLHVIDHKDKQRISQKLKIPIEQMRLEREGNK